SMSNLATLMDSYTYDDGKTKALQVLSNAKLIEGKGASVQDIENIVSAQTYDPGRTAVLGIVCRVVNVPITGIAAVISHYTYDEGKYNAFNLMYQEDKGTD